MVIDGVPGRQGEVDERLQQFLLGMLLLQEVLLPPHERFQAELLQAFPVSEMELRSQRQFVLLVKVADDCAQVAAEICCGR